MLEVCCLGHLQSDAEDSDLGWNDIENRNRRDDDCDTQQHVAKDTILLRQDRSPDLFAKVLTCFE